MTALPLIEDVSPLLDQRVPMIDVRAPIEFEKGALPFARNLPLLEDAERHQVGLCYKNNGQDAAIMLGHKLVSGLTRQSRIESWRQFVATHPDAVLYCARGGLRSTLSQQWLADIGVPIPRVQGGYKQIRRALLTYLDAACLEQSFVLLSGMTGTGKTEMIQTVDRAIDLEQLANHKGSSFGRPLDEQPAQIDFENSLILELMRLRRKSPESTIVLEDEDRKIGGRHLPPQFVAAMKASSMVVIELPFEERIERLWQEYVIDRYNATIALYPSDGEHRFAAYLHDSVHRIQKRLGGERTADIQASINDALANQHNDGFAGHRDWLETITADYYDPMYDYQLEKQQARIVFRGRPEEVTTWLQSSVCAA
ncbi:MAG: tRNA 2-selenouridine(34) synthase MnmH [Pseudomonadota bacterium]